MATNTTACINGELQPGDLVISSPQDEYALLVGTVLSINKVGTPEHDAETDNETDDIHVNFMDMDYSERRIVEIEKMFSGLYGYPKKFGECPIDDAIMSPDTLIRVTDIGQNLLMEILGSKRNAEAFCERFVDERSAGDRFDARLDSNFIDFMEILFEREARDLTNISGYIAVVAATHARLKVPASLDDEAREYLLQFHNPLEKIADELSLQNTEDRLIGAIDVSAAVDAMLGRHVEKAQETCPTEPSAQAAAGFIEEKLFSPLKCEIALEENEEYYDGDYWSDPILQSEAVCYMDEINEAIKKQALPEENDRGLMEYFHEDGEVGRKVHSMFAGVEEHAGKLWGVATLQLAEPLTLDEMEVLKEYWCGQESDGFGEGFEQREIKIEDIGDLYVHFWHSGEGFFIDTSSEFGQRIGIAKPKEKHTYTVNELIGLMEPQSRKDKALAAQTCVGLTKYAAELAASGRINWFHDAIAARAMVEQISDFWVLEDRQTNTNFLRDFDSIIEDTVRTPQGFEPATDAEQEVVMHGLASYAYESVSVGGLDFSGQITAAQSLMAEISGHWDTVQPLCDKLNAGIDTELNALKVREAERSEISEKASVRKEIRKSREETKSIPAVLNNNPPKNQPEH